MLAQVPFPRMHFLLSSLAPVAAPRDVAALNAPRSVDQVGHLVTRSVSLSHSKSRANSSMLQIHHRRTGR